MRRWSTGDHEGAVALEFALITPVLVLLLFGILQFGLAMWRTSTIESAAREGARIASVGATIPDITGRVHAAATGFNLDEVDVDTPGCGAVGEDVTVTVTTDPDVDRLKLSIPFWGEKAVSYSAVATFRCERTMGAG